MLCAKAEEPMPSSSGFQNNSTISNAFWRWIPSADDPTGRIIYIALNGLQFIEATQDSQKAWLYYAANNVASSQEPYILQGLVAQAFLGDLGGLF